MLTARMIDEVPTPTSGRVRLSDSAVRGFHAIITPRRTVTFYLEYGPRHRRRKVRIGTYPAMTVLEARDKARRLLGAYHNGRDPARERDAARAIPFYRDWVEEYLRALEGKRKSLAEIRAYLVGRPGGRGNRPGESVSKPKPSDAWKMFQNRRLNEITAEDVQRWFDTVSARGKIAANRGLVALRRCFQKAVARHYIRENPAAHIERWPENPPRNIRLNDDERARLLQAIVELSNPYLKVFFLTLFLTGCRKSEALAARWEHIDLERGDWLIPSPKSGYPQTIPLPSPLVEALRDLPRRKGNPYVFPGKRRAARNVVEHESAARHMTEPVNAWRALRKRCGIEHVHLHDMRRDYCYRVTKAAGLEMASRLLRHSSLAITERVYSGLKADDFRGATEAAAAALPFVAGVDKRRQAT